jgi:hypothetical protein
VKKERFREIIQNYSSNLDDINSLKKLAYDYPFSQIIHLLLANASKKSIEKEFKPNLSNAAFHTTDRSILKSLIEHNLVPSEHLTGNAAQKINSINIKSKSDSVIPSPIDSDLLIAEVLDNLELLQKKKKETAFWFEDDPKTKPKKKAVSTKKAEKKVKTQKKSPKAKKQTTIIEKFIKEEPTITKNANPVNDKQDMAKESGKMRDDVVSESLAKIYIKQGKTGKAIDIYKKLIWKLPQKKALFAAQIEKLKKK